MADRHPRINHDEWTDQEIEQLKRIAQETKVNWVQVAKDLGVSSLTPLRSNLILYSDKPHSS